MRIALGMIALAAAGALLLFVTSAEPCYQSAERLYSQGEFERAAIQCKKALLRNPRHAPARALTTELQFILGRGKATPYSPEYAHFMHRSFIPTSQVLNEVDQALVRAERCRLAGDLEAAHVEVRKILEFLKWVPSGNELDARRNEVEILKARLATDGSPDD